jgi:hypothetical protein
VRHRSDERLIHGIAKWLVTLIGERGNPSPEASTPTELASSNCQDWSASNWGLIGAGRKASKPVQLRPGRDAGRSACHRCRH